VATTWSRGHEEDVGRHVAGDAQADRSEQGEPVDALRRMNGDLRGEPAAERSADHVDAIEPEPVEDLEVVVDEVVHRLDLGQIVRAAEARVVWRDHLEVAG
jgi:hypothetical protein